MNALVVVASGTLLCCSGLSEGRLEMSTWKIRDREISIQGTEDFTKVVFHVLGGYCCRQKGALCCKTFLQEV